MMTHLPSNPFCEVCQQAKMKWAPGKAVPREEQDRAKVFGEGLLADHMTLADHRAYDIEAETCSLCLKDDSSGFRAWYPQTSKGTEQTVRSIKHFIGQCKLGKIRSDNNWRACQILQGIKSPT